MVDSEETVPLMDPEGGVWDSLFIEIDGGVERGPVDGAWGGGG